MSTSSLSPEPEEPPMYSHRSGLNGGASDGGLPYLTLGRSPDDVVALANRASVDSLAALVASDGQLVRSRLLRGSHKFIVEVARAPYDKADRRRIWEIFKENMGASYKVSSFGWTPSAKKSELFHEDSRYILLRHATPVEVKLEQAKAEASDATVKEPTTSTEVDVEQHGPQAASSALAGPSLSPPSTSTVPTTATDNAPPSLPPHTALSVKETYSVHKDDEERQVSDLLGPASSPPPSLALPTLLPAAESGPSLPPSTATAPLSAILCNPPAPLPATVSGSFTSSSAMVSSPLGGVNGKKYPFSLLSSTPPPPTAAPAPKPIPTSVNAKGKARLIEVGERRRSARFQPTAAAAAHPTTSTDNLLSSPQAVVPPTSAGATTTAILSTPGSTLRFHDVTSRPALKPLRTPTMTASAAGTPPSVGPTSSAAKSTRSSARRSVTLGVDYRELNTLTGRYPGVPNPESVASPSTPRQQTARVLVSATATASNPASTSASSSAVYDPFAKRTKRGRPRKESVERRLAAEAELEALEARARAERRHQRRLEEEEREREEKERAAMAVEGYLMWRFDTEPDEQGKMEPIVYLYELSVAKEFQRAGLGRYLVSRLESLGRAWGCRKVILTVLKSNNKAMDFYRKMGYEIDHSSPSRFTWSDSDVDSSAEDTPAGAAPPAPQPVLALPDDDLASSVSPSSPPPTAVHVTSNGAAVKDDGGAGEVSGMLWIGGTWRKVKYDYEIMSKVLVEDAAASAPASHAAIGVAGPATPAALVGTGVTPGNASASTSKDRRGRSRRRTLNGETPPTTRRKNGTTTTVNGPLPSSLALPTVDAAHPLPPLPDDTPPSTNIPAADNGNKKKRKRSAAPLADGRPPLRSSLRSTDP